MMEIIRGGSRISTDFVIPSGKKLYFDGAGGVGGDTYMLESSANVLDTYVGGTKIITANSTAVGIGGTPTTGTLDVFGTSNQVARFRVIGGATAGGFFDIYDTSNSIQRGFIGFGTAVGSSINDFTVSSGSGSNLKLAINGTTALTIDTLQNITHAAHTYVGTDNTFDLFASGVRGRSVYIGTSLVNSGTMTAGAGKFAVDANGNITKLNNVTTSFPSSNAVGILKNDGAGTLTWVDDSGGESSRVSTQFDKTSSTATSDITGLTAALSGARTYEFEAILYTTSNVAAGVLFAIEYSDIANIGSIVYEAVVFSAAGTVAQTRATARNTDVGGITAVTAALCRIVGTITLTGGSGNLTVQFAQNFSNVAASSVLVGSTFSVNDIT